jgi:serine/threonine-protein kinase
MQQPGPLTVGEKVLDRYLVVGQMETGGTSVVYRGQDERLARPVCIKVFHNLKYKDRILRTTYEHFIQEAFALSKLTHPNTLRIYDFAHLLGPDGRESGAPFQVSEFMNGGTLSNLVRNEGALERSEVVHIVSLLCGALEEAHDFGIIHRDIKPRNILFGTTGSKRSPKLADFGIAKALQVEKARLINRAGETQVVAGRKLLMYSGLWAAPEQLAARDASPAVDVYSMALLAAYMMTGRCVYSDTDPSSAYRERKRAEERIDDVMRDADYPEGIAALLKSSCAFEPEARPTIADFARSFTDIVAGAGRPGPRATPPKPPLAPLPDPDSETSPPEKSGPPRPISVTGEPQPIGDRVVYFAPLVGGKVDLRCAGARIRVSLIPTGTTMAVHIKGLTCFVAKRGGRPSSASQLDASGRIRLFDKRQRPLADVSVRFPRPAAGHNVFQVGSQLVAIRLDQAPLIFGLDFGPRSECYFVHVPAGAGARARGEGRKLK